MQHHVIPREVPLAVSLNGSGGIRTMLEMPRALRVHAVPVRHMTSHLHGFFFRGLPWEPFLWPPPSLPGEKFEGGRRELFFRGLPKNKRKRRSHSRQVFSFKKSYKWGGVRRDSNPHPWHITSFCRQVDFNSTTARKQPTELNKCHPRPLSVQTLELNSHPRGQQVNRHTIRHVHGVFCRAK